MSVVAPEAITEPGVYADMPEEDYLADPVPGGSLSSSGARQLLPPGCPALFHHEQGHPRPGSAAQNFGSAAHKILLGVGPELVAFPEHDARTREGRPIRDEWDAAAAEGKIPILEPDYDRINAMVAAVREHPLAAALFEPENGAAEQSAFWREPIDFAEPIWCRARFDWLPEVRNDRIIFPDYKTALRVDDESIQKAVARYRYDQQIDFYQRAGLELGLSENVMGVLVFQMKDPPYIVRVVTFDAEQRRIAAARNERAIRIYAECKHTGKWPAYGDGLHTTSLPAWAVREDTEEYIK